MVVSPSTDPHDIWRSAKLVMAEHGERAPEHTARRISELTAQGDTAGTAVWGDILAAIDTLRLGEPPVMSPPGSTAH
jgi:hypothetical protein